MHGALGQLKAALTVDTLVLDEGTPQALGLTMEDRRVWGAPRGVQPRRWLTTEGSVTAAMRARAPRDGGKAGCASADRTFGRALRCTFACSVQWKLPLGDRKDFERMAPDC